MILKSLLLQGFKSFPDKTEIRFVSGMTAIVGPNGSGKSNISDAIRWVLGEQSSRSLRGAKMEDVIFSGTAKRNAAAWAEVSLLLDNSAGTFRSAFTEILITRRYYRSGESDYFLNKKRCRLRDIHELFMDTGLGRDGYSVIGQGRIDEILSWKSEDRREIFEETAGITKFRYRKEEAERRLSATEENMTRIRDIYEELDRQLLPLSKQAEKATQYLQLQEELRIWELSLWLFQLEQIHSDTVEQNSELSLQNNQIENEKQTQDNLYAQAQSLTTQVQDLEQGVNRLRQQLRDTERQAAEQAGRAAIESARVQNDKDTIDRTQRENIQRQTQAETLEKQLLEHRARIRTIETQQETVQSQMTRLQQRNQSQAARQTAAEQTLRQAEQECEQKRQALHALDLDHIAAQTGLNSMEERRSALLIEREDAQLRLHDEQSEQAALETRLTNCLKNSTEAKEKSQKLAQELERRREHTEQLQRHITRLQSDWKDAQSRAQMLRDMQKDYEGFSRSVKSIMTQAKYGKLQGVYGPVSSLLTVEERFVGAIDTALGASASSIVVDTSINGKRCIEYLKHSDGGRATFLPLDTIQFHGSAINGLHRYNGCFGTADKLVSFSPQYANIVQNLLARTIITDTIETALTVARAYQQRFRVVTLDGQIIQAGGAMTGGSTSHGTGALARAARLTTAQEQAAALSVQYTEAYRTYQQETAELDELKSTYQTIEKSCISLGQEEAGLRAELRQHQVLLDNIHTQYDRLQQEHETFLASRRQYETTLDTFESRRIQAQKALSEAEEQLSRCRAEVERLTAEYDANATQTSALQTTLSENQSELATANRVLTDLEQLKNNITIGMTEAKRTIRQFEQDMQSAEENCTRAEQAAQSARQQTILLEKQIEEQTARRQKTEENRRQIDRQIQEQTQIILTLERQKNGCENHLAQLQKEETQILDTMWERYEITPTPAAQIAKHLTDNAEAKARAQELRNNIKSLGAVNLDAVKDYQQVSERHTFIGKQKTDLEKAQRELYQVIEELTDQMKDIFSDAFAKLNLYFKETFSEMFGGGHAELVLTDPSDILNCGIEIRVSPPGKSVKTLTLLSGGEKAFVAIALYFAILKLHPTPFCILDEIEAALDDVNVSRFARYLRRLSDKTQFIAITHRRGTMEEADVLYGVTMQEQGVSRLLMLDLVETEKKLGRLIR